MIVPKLPEQEQATLDERVQLVALLQLLGLVDARTADRFRDQLLGAAENSPANRHELLQQLCARNELTTEDLRALRGFANTLEQELQMVQDQRTEVSNRSATAREPAEPPPRSASEPTLETIDELKAKHARLEANVQRELPQRDGDRPRTKSSHKKPTSRRQKRRRDPYHEWQPARYAKMARFFYVAKAAVLQRFSSAAARISSVFRRRHARSAGIVGVGVGVAVVLGAGMWAHYHNLIWPTNNRASSSPVAVGQQDSPDQAGSAPSEEEPRADSPSPASQTSPARSSNQLALADSPPTDDIALPQALPPTDDIPLPKVLPPTDDIPPTETATESTATESTATESTATESTATESTATENTVAENTVAENIRESGPGEPPTSLANTEPPSERLELSRLIEQREFDAALEHVEGMTVSESGEHTSLTAAVLLAKGDSVAWATAGEMLMADPRTESETWRLLYATWLLHANEKARRAALSKLSADPVATTPVANTPVALRLQAWLQARNGEWAEALKTLADLPQEQCEIGDLIFRATAYIQAGDREQAAVDLQQLTTLLAASDSRTLIERVCNQRLVPAHQRLSGFVLH